MNLKTMALIAVAVWTPIITDADAGTRINPDLQRTALKKCLSESQILAQLRKKGYRTLRTDPRRSSRSAYLITSIRHRQKLEVKVDRCTGKILGVQAVHEAARLKPGVDRLRQTPKITLKCLSKSAIYQKLKDRGYNYLKPEQISGPHDSPKGKVYRAQTLVKAGHWCQVKIAVSCYNAKILEYETLQDTCIY